MKTVRILVTYENGTSLEDVDVPDGNTVAAMKILLILIEKKGKKYGYKKVLKLEVVG